MPHFSDSPILRTARSLWMKLRRRGLASRWTNPYQCTQLVLLREDSGCTFAAFVEAIGIPEGTLVLRRLSRGKTAEGKSWPALQENLVFERANRSALVPWNVAHNPDLETLIRKMKGPATRTARSRPALPAG